MTVKTHRARHIAAAIASGGLTAFAAFFAAGCQESQSQPGMMSKEQQINFVKSNGKMSPEEKDKAIKRIEAAGNK